MNEYYSFQILLLWLYMYENEIKVQPVFLIIFCYQNLKLASFLGVGYHGTLGSVIIKGLWMLSMLISQEQTAFHTQIHIVFMCQLLISI